MTHIIFTRQCEKCGGFIHPRQKHFCDPKEQARYDCDEAYKVVMSEIEQPRPWKPEKPFVFVAFGILIGVLSLMFERIFTRLIS